MKLIETITRYIEDNQLFDKNDKIVLGVSGGLDSVVLLDIMHKLGYEIVIAHCNFHLRKNESIRDEKFVEDLALSYNLQYEKTDFETLNYAASNKISIEMAARELRYNWFEEIREKVGARYIAVAHHINDSIETILLNVTRGTGLKGILGISPKVGHIVRPFLCLYREDLEKYTKDNDLKYITDSTNLEAIYKRNSMRLDVLPLLKQMNPSVNKAIEDFSYRMREVDKIYSHYINENIDNILKNNSINIKSLNQTISPKSVLYEILNSYGFTPSTINDLYKILDTPESGKIFLSEEYIALKDRDFVYLKKKEDIDHTAYEIGINETITNPIHLQLSEKNVSELNDLNTPKNICYLDKSKLTFPLVLRKWEKGDRFTPLGMKGAKKLSDYFSDKKFSLFDKENAWILLSNDEIVWIVGERSDNNFKVTSNTSEIVIIEYKK